MTNPPVLPPTGIDIRESANRVVASLRGGQGDEGFSLLERIREPERVVVQEAIDRYVAASLLRDGGSLPEDMRLRHADAVERLHRALGPPRMPDLGHVPDRPNELMGLTRVQRYHVYASIVEARGDEAARADLRRNDHVVLLGLRRETPTFASHGNGRSGTGVYDDQIVVLGTTERGAERIYIAGRATTEPTAQYAHHAGSDGDRPFSGNSQTELRRIAPAVGYEEVRRRKIEGEDVNGDSIWDLGRMAEGTIEMFRADHPNPRSVGTRDAFRPSPEQMTRGGRMVQRDSNADGYFTPADPAGIQPLNETFKIHSGSRNNADSAGCQTIHPDDYRDFINAAQRNPAQTRWQYVLTSTQGGLFHNVEVGRDEAPAQAPAQRPQALPQPTHQPAHHPAHQPLPQPPPLPVERQGNTDPVPGPFENPDLNRYYAAVLAGDAALANRIAFDFSFRAPERAAQHVAEAQSEPTQAQFPPSAHDHETLLLRS
ncbi:hypothetical protein [Luteimonas sp. SDU82]|uniref:hypothetical protein n=1 Tax=Luteimonas sp. SDU82 TaxID=3422592 RepID=UPI003EBAAC5B